MPQTRPRAERLNGRVPHTEPIACEAEGCTDPGEFKAPRDNRGGGREWRWLCLDHVRKFNGAYNYFDGMSPDEISDAQSPYPAWERATRAFATNGYADKLNFEDNAELIKLRFGARAFEEARARNGSPISPADRKALWPRSNWTAAPPTSRSANVMPSWCGVSTRTATAATARTRDGCGR